MLTATFFASGQTTHVLDLARGLARRGHRVDVWITHGRGGRAAHAAAVATLEEAGVAVRFLPAPVVPGRDALPLGAYDVVHAQSSWSFDLARRLAATLDRPLVLTCHGLGLDKPAYGPALQAAARLICVGPRVARDLQAYRSKILVIGNGVDLERFRPGIREARWTLLYAGRVDRWKRPGIEALCQAVARLPKDAQVWAAANRRLPSPRIRHLGWVADLERVMGRVHVVVGTGRVIREGMAAGAACVVLGREYHGPVTPEGVAGMTFPDFSGAGRRLGSPTSKAILDDLLSLYRNRTRLQELMAFGRRFAEQHLSLDAMVEATLGVYRAVTDPAGGAGGDVLAIPRSPASNEPAEPLPPEGDASRGSAPDHPALQPPPKDPGPSRPVPSGPAADEPAPPGDPSAGRGRRGRRCPVAPPHRARAAGP